VSTARLVPNDAASGRAQSEPGSVPATRRALLIFGLVVGVVLLDQITKAWAVASLADEPLSIIGDRVELRLSRNPGGAFSILTGFTPLLAVLAAIVAIVLVRVAQRAKDPVMVVALSLVLGGALGNLSDRLFRAPGFLRGEVVDFVRIGAFPSFNVADSAVTIGAVLLLLWGWRDRDERREPG
jgi:signal peptidase II